MATLRRILKYTPAALIGVLAAVWASNIFWKVSIHLPGYSSLHLISVAYGGVTYFYIPDGSAIPRYKPGRIEVERSHHRHYTGAIRFSNHPLQARLAVPFAVLITAILPIAVGSFTRFRFRLWHYLAYTALVAVELAYYLRWQR
jgi:hypothetical protein